MASRIAKLAAQIASNTQKVDNFLNTNKLPQPSFDEDGPVELGLSTDIETARLAVLNDTLELQALLQGPVQLLRPIVRSAPLPLPLFSIYLSYRLVYRSNTSYS